MALKIGTIQADIGADTSDLKRAEDEVIRSTNKMDRQLLKTEKASNSVSKGFKNTGRSAGQAGIQIQQFVGQLQGGQNAFVALSQQSADLGFVLGAPLVGVIVSLAAVIGGVLWQSLSESSEAMERAETSAADLTKEYLKLTGQTKALSVAKLADQIIEDSAAIRILSAELIPLNARLDNLNKRRRGPTRGKTEAISNVEREIDTIQNKLDGHKENLEEKQKDIDKLLTEIAGGDLGATDAPQDAGAGTGGNTFDQLMQQEIAALQLRASLFSDSNLAIEAELMRFELAALEAVSNGNLSILEAEEGLAQKRIELQEKANAAIEKKDTQDALKLANQKKAQQQASLSGLASFAAAANELISASGAEGTSAAKAVFLAMKGIQVAQIIAATETSAALASVSVAGSGTVAWLASQAGIRAIGYANAGLVAGLAVGGGRQHGGSVSPQMAHQINEAGTPEILNQGGKQFLLPTGQGGNITPMKAGMGGGSMPSIVINNLASGVAVEVESMTAEQVTIIARQEAKRSADGINASLSSGRGASADSVRNGFNIPRNIK